MRQLVLTWGTFAVQSEIIGSYSDMAKQAAHIAEREGFAVKGDHLVVVAGVPFGVAGSTNNVRVLEV